MDRINQQGLALSHLGIGTFGMGEDSAKEAEEIEILRSAIFHDGINVIDTAEMYGEGKAESLIGKAFQKEERSHFFLISKIYPWNATADQMRQHCVNSLRRLNSDYLDLYLLHWKGNADFSIFVREAENLRKSGLIKHWGVSNIDVEDLEKIRKIPGGENCYADQILYHLGARGVEYNLLPYLAEHHLLAIGYSPMADSKERQQIFLQNKTLVALAAKKGISVQNLLLLFALQRKNLLVLFKSSSLQHYREDLAAASLYLTSEELAELDAVFPAPKKAMPLESI